MPHSYNQQILYNTIEETGRNILEDWGAMTGFHENYKIIGIILDDDDA